MRQVVLDTETTGLDWGQGHRIIEIGCVEILNRRKTDAKYHVYINPQRAIDAGAQEVHGISSQDLADKPLFAEIVEDFLEFVGDAELVIHNASFDVGFLDNELRLAGLDSSQLSKRNSIMDTLLLARQIHPGQRNSLDALCKRYGIDNSRRDLHGALLDSRLLAEVYLAMTGGQTALSLGDDQENGANKASGKARKIDRSGVDLVIVHATEAEIKEHDDYMDTIDKANSGKSLWRRA
jgi:DNA polymerase-3 subunit epsilon